MIGTGVLTALVSLILLAGPASAAGPAAPSGFTGVTQSSASVRWSWTDNANNENGFRVLFGTVNLSGDLANNTTFWLQTGLTANRLVGPLLVQAFTGGNASNSGTASTYTYANAPASFQVTARSSTTATLAWTANGNSAGTRYQLERSVGAGPFLFIASTTASGYLELSLTPLTSYSWRARALNGAGAASTYAAAASTTTAAPDPPAAPSAFAGTALDTARIQWHWTDNASNETGFRVLSGTTNLSGDLAAGATYWLQTGLGANSSIGPLLVQAFNAGGTSNSGTASRATLAAVPASFSVASVSSTTVVLGWSANGNSAGTVYDVESLSTTTASSYTDAGLLPSTTHSYRVRARNSEGVNTAYAGPISTTTLTPDAPAAPWAFTGTALFSSQLRWTWADASNNETGFRVLSGTINVSGDLPAGATYWLQSGVAPNTLVGPLLVQAFNTGGANGSAAASTRTLAALPSAFAVAVVSSTTVTLSWSANGNPAGTIYELEGLSTTTAASYTQTGLTPSTTHTYRVRAVSGDGTPTAFAGPVSTTTLTPDAPNAPSGFSGAAVSDSELLWTWTDASDNETGLRVLSGTVNLSGDLAAGTTYWLQNGATANTLTGPLVVQAFNAGGASGSAEASARTRAAAPTALAFVSVTSTTLSLSWSSDNPAGTTFEIESLSTTTASSYTDAGLVPSPTHAYRVRAVSGDGVPTAWAGPISTTTLAPDAPGAPTGLAATPVSTTELLWTWTDNSPNEDGYRVLSGTINVSGDLPPGTTLWLQGGLSTNTLAGPMLVQAFNGGGIVDSSPASKRTLAAVPAGFAANSVSSTAVSLAWSADGNPAGTVFELESLSSTTAVSYTDAGLLPSTTHSYRVRAVSGDGVPTAWAGPVSTATLPADPVATVRAIVASPGAGQTVRGDRLTILAQLTAGAQPWVSRVRFQYKPSQAAVWADVASPVAAQHNPDSTCPYFVQWDASALPPGPYDLRAVAYDVGGAPDFAPPTVSVFVSAAGAALFETTEAGGKRLEQALVPGLPQTAVSASPSTSQLTTLRLPAGAVAAPGLLTLHLRTGTGISAAATAGDVIVLELSGGPADLPAGAPAIVTISYPDEDGDGVIDGTPWTPAQLRLMALAPNGAWAAAPATVDAAAHTVSGTVWSLRGIGLFAPQAAALEGARVFPMPYKPHAGNPNFGVPFAPGDPNSGVIFDNVPPGARIRIYTVSGRRVRTLSADGAGHAQWDVKNDGGDDVASGGYLAVIEASGRRDVTRKLLIVK